MKHRYYTQYYTVIVTEIHTGSLACERVYPIEYCSNFVCHIIKPIPELPDLPTREDLKPFVLGNMAFIDVPQGLKADYKSTKPLYLLDWDKVWEEFNDYYKEKQASYISFDGNKLVRANDLSFMKGTPKRFFRKNPYGGG